MVSPPPPPLLLSLAGHVPRSSLCNFSADCVPFSSIMIYFQSSLLSFILSFIKFERWVVPGEWGVGRWERGSLLWSLGINPTAEHQPRAHLIQMAISLFNLLFSHFPQLTSIRVLFCSFTEKLSLSLVIKYKYAPLCPIQCLRSRYRRVDSRLYRGTLG